MKTKKKKSGTLSTILLLLILLIGLSLLLYPTLSNYWNSIHQTHAIASYVQQVADMDAELAESVWNAAVEYNKDLSERSGSFHLTPEQEKAYEEQLNIGENGVMGYLDIPSINVTLPIYHGTSDSVLQVAAGHLDWTSLPVGGKSSHCVLSGHRGLPRAKLFTDLDKLRVGDEFLIDVLNEVLTYEVDKILVVEPHDTKDLQIEPGKDYCTLVTCTPYGINSHRLLVRGHRIETKDPNAIRITSDAVVIEPLIVAPIIAVPLLIILIILFIILDGKQKRKVSSTEEDEDET